MTPSQLVTAILGLLMTAIAGTIVVLERGTVRRGAYVVLAATALVSIAAWTNFGRFQEINVDADHSEVQTLRAKIRKHRPFHFHDFVHYYLGPKYFRELGYRGLYDCIALADQELADAAHVPHRIKEWVRDLDDVLTDKPYDVAVGTCTTVHRPRFSDARWAEFKGDVRGLQHLVDDDAWQSVTYDAGFNPPPSPIVVSGLLTNLIPLWSGSTETYLLATSLDLLLLIACFFAVSHAFGRTTAAVLAVYFGASLISHYTWNGGSVLRFTWLAELVLGLCALKRQRWRLAGAVFALAAMDRVFPLAFGVFAMVPIALRARSSLPHRAILRQYSTAFAGTAALLFVVSAIVYGPSAWGIFFSRILRHGDVYYVMHIGLKKVLTYRDWVPKQDFGGHTGLMHFRDWNLALRETWSQMRVLVVPVQLLLAGGAAWASRRRKPYEAALLGGVVCMFTFALPANYYYAVLALIPALVLRAAATAPSREQRYASFVVFGLFTAYWAFTCLANQLSRNLILVNLYISEGLLAFLVAWIACWSLRLARPPLVLEKKKS